MRHQAHRTAIRNEARRWIDGVQAADGASLESGVVTAMVTLIDGIKADYGDLSVFDSMLIMAGPRTLAGALVPLRGPAPTNVGFVPGDYNRRGGFIGGGNGKRIATNQSFTVARKLSHHIAVNATSAAAADWHVYATNSTSFTEPQTVGSVSMQSFNTFSNDFRGTSARITAGALIRQSGLSTGAGFRGVHRVGNTDFTVWGTTSSAVVTQGTCTDGEFLLNPFVVAADVTNAGTCDINFWCCGTGINLAALRTRLNTYETTLAGLI